MVVKRNRKRLWHGLVERETETQRRREKKPDPGMYVEREKDLGL